MRRGAIFSAILLALWIAALWATGGLAAVGTQPVGSVRIQDGFHTQLLRVDHNGAAVVTCVTSSGVAESCGGSGSSGDAVNVFHQSTIRHISSTTHITGSLFLTNQAGTAVTVTGTALDVNCTGCAAASVVAVTHISSALHIAGTIIGASFHVQGLGIPGQAHGGVLTIQGITGGVPVPISGTITAGDAVNVFHQSTIRHISSEVHALIRVPQGYALHVGAFQGGSWTIQAAHQGGEWNIRHVGSYLHVVVVDWQRWAHLQVSQSGAWNVTAHQGGQWNIAHISSALHIAGTINGAPFHVQGLGIPGQAHGGVLTIQGVTGGVPVPISGTITAGDAVNVFHQSTVRHISSEIHALIRVPQGYALHVAAFQGGSWSTQATHQGGEWNVRHVSVRTHVLIEQSDRNRIGVHVTDRLCLTCSALVTHGGGLSVAGFGADQTVLVATNTTPFRVAHVTSLLHIVVKPSSNANDVLAMHIQDAGTGCLTCRARVDHYNMLVVQPHISGALRTWQVTSCGTSASLAINTNANRRDLWVMNRGNGNIYIGYGATGHVALTTANGWPLHATASAVTTTARHSTALSTVYLQNYQGPLACISDLAGQTLQVMEILR